MTPTGAGKTLGPAATLAPTGVPDGAGGASAPTAPAAGIARGGAGGSGETVRPTRLTLPSGHSAAVDPAGLYPDGALKVPDLPSRVGWWTGGASAGDPYGSMVVAGHVDSRKYGLGALAELAKVQVGAVFGVTGPTVSGAARTFRYRVTSIRKVPQADLVAEAAPFAQDVPHRLVVITCGGVFNTSTHHYSDNVVVSATPVG